MTRSTRGRRGRRKIWRHVGWWSNTPLEHFTPLLDFANQRIEETNWADALWRAMGRERLCWLVTSEDRKKTYLSEVDPYADVTPHLPTISGQAATHELTQALQTDVRRVFNALAKTADEVHRQRGGQGDATWMERTKQRDLGFELTGRASNYSAWPWFGTHYEAMEEILQTIKTVFNASDVRSGTIHSTSGFIAFDDAGEDAPTTFAWMLMGLVEVVFREERPVLRRCPFCQKYFIHVTMRTKTYCSDSCRYNFHNKGLGSCVP